MNLAKRLSNLHKKAQKAAKKGNQNKARALQHALKQTKQRELYETTDNVGGTW